MARAAIKPTFISTDALRSSLRAAGDGARAPASVYRLQVGTPKALEDGSRKVRFCFSDQSVDRMGDTIDPAGWNLHSFEKNPVALWAHDSSAPPIGRASDVRVIDGRLMGDIEFAPPETYAFADTIYRLVKDRYLNAVSVGFMALEYDWSDDEDREWGMDFKRQELMEISVCPVPANSNALAEARSKGLDTRPLVEWAEKTLEGGGKIILPRAEVEQLRKAAAEPRRPRRRADGGGMIETDPAGGGAVVATCARSTDEECGMSNPMECSVHMTTAAEDKRLADMIAKAVSTGVTSALKGVANKGGTPVRPSRRRREASEDDVSSASDPATLADLAAAHEHMKAMGDCLDEAADHHEKAMDLIDGIMEGLDTNPEGETGADSSQSDEKSASARVLRALRNAS